MAGSICSNCNSENPPGYTLCTRCGADLQRPPIIIQEPSSLTIGSPRLPSRELKAIGVSVAVSVLALLAEAGVIWLRRRVRHMEMQPYQKDRKTRLPAVMEEQAAPPRKNKRVTTVLSERVIEEKRWGRAPRRIIERFAWRHEEEQV